MSGGTSGRRRRSVALPRCRPASRSRTGTGSPRRCGPWPSARAACPWRRRSPAVACAGDDRCTVSSSPTLRWWADMKCGLATTSSARPGSNIRPCEHDRPLDALQQARVARREAQVGAAEPAAGAAVRDRGAVVDDEQARRADLGQRLDLGPVEAGLVGEHGDVGGERARPQPVVRRLPAPRPGDRREHGPGGQRDEQPEHDQRPPSPPHVKPQPGNRHASPRQRTLP